MMDLVFHPILPHEYDAAAEIERLCFSSSEACSETVIKARASAAPDMFLVALQGGTGRCAGILTGLATDETAFRDEFFNDETLHSKNGKNVMLLSLAVHPDFRGQGLALALMREYSKRQAVAGRQRLILTCHAEKVSMYQKMGYRDLGISRSVWGGAVWHEMVCNLQKEK